MKKRFEESQCLFNWSSNLTVGDVIEKTEQKRGEHRNQQILVANLCEFLIEKGIISEIEFLEKILDYPGEFFPMEKKETP